MGDMGKQRVDDSGSFVEEHGTGGFSSMADDFEATFHPSIILKKILGDNVVNELYEVHVNCYSSILEAATREKLNRSSMETYLILCKSS